VSERWFVHWLTLVATTYFDIRWLVYQCLTLAAYRWEPTADIVHTSLKAEYRLGWDWIGNMGMMEILSDETKGDSIIGELKERAMFEKERSTESFTSFCTQERVLLGPNTCDVLESICAIGQSNRIQDTAYLASTFLGAITLDSDRHDGPGRAQKI
jgi:hypothetical protein